MRMRIGVPLSGADEAAALLQRERPDREEFKAAVQRLRTLTHEFDQNQIKRIQDNTSKTRLSILFYAFMWDCLKIAEQTNHLLKIFRDPLRPAASLDRNGDPVAPPQAGPGSERDEAPAPETVDA